MDPLKFIAPYEATIYVVTIAICVVFAGLIFLLLRNAKPLQEKNWVLPFANTFLVLALLYGMSLIGLWGRKGSIRPWELAGVDLVKLAISFTSGITNYLFLTSAFLLPEPAIPRHWISINERLLRDRPYRIFLPLLFGAIGLLGFFGGNWQIPDAVCSVIALFLMGLALYKNTIRIDHLAAWLGLVSGLVYSLFYLFSIDVVTNVSIVRVVGLYVPDLLVKEGVKETFVYNLGTLISLVTLFLKLGFFLSAYALMLWISSPLQGLEELLRGTAHDQKEFLGSEGLVKEICTQLGVEAVMLYIRQPEPYQPGNTEKTASERKEQIALFQFSAVPRPLVPQPIIRQFDEKTAIFHKVMRSGRWDRNNNEDSYHWLFPKAAEIGVPVFFHDSVIACLTAVVKHGQSFPKSNRINLQRFAGMISPAVQNYREMSALNNLSQSLGKHQIDIGEYELEANIREIADIVNEITSPNLTFIQVDRGFYSYPPVFLGDRVTESEAEAYTRELTLREGDDDFVSEDGKYRWLTRRLMIPGAVSSDNPPYFGQFALGISTQAQADQPRKHRAHPTIGTDPTCRRAVCDLVSDTLLDFVRGYLNQHNDTLGRRLSGLEVRTPAGWRAQVEETAKDVKLAWVVARCSDDNDPEATVFLGDPKWIALVQKLEGLDSQNQWKAMGSDLQLSPIEDSGMVSGQVIRRTLMASQNACRINSPDALVTLWIGVTRPEFGEELQQKTQWGMSPWRYFLAHFCDIADAALLRILKEGNEARRNERMSELERFAAARVVASNTLHALARIGRELTAPIEELEFAARARVLDGGLNDAIFKLAPACREINNRLTSLRKALSEEDRPPCELDTVIKQVCDSVENNWLREGIKLVRPKPTDCHIHVPFHVAVFAFETLLHNGRDAIWSMADSNQEDHKITISVSDQRHEIVCTITDTGPGIPAHLLPILTHKPLPSSKSGGVGLYLSAFLLRGYRSNIVPESPNGGGAVFTIHFRKAENKSE